MKNKHFIKNLALINVVGLISIIFITGCGGDSLPKQTESTDYNAVIEANSSLGGQIIPRRATITKGGNLEFNVIPDSGYKVESITGCNGFLKDNIYYVNKIIESCNIKVIFIESKTYQVNTIVNKGGRLIPSEASIEDGKDFSFEIEVLTGYKLENIQGCSGLIEKGTYKISNVKSDCTIRVQFIDIRQAPKDVVVNIKDEEAVINWLPNEFSRGYRIYYSEKKFSDTSESHITVVNKLPSVTSYSLPLLKSYNRFYVKLSTVYDNIEVLSEDVIEINSNFQSLVQINDTGTEYCLNDRYLRVKCDLEAYSGQDGYTGRDRRAAVGMLKKVGGGNSGFDYIKIDSNGHKLVKQNVNWEIGGTESDGSIWSCVRDNVTGLVWEIKSGSVLRDQNLLYAWFNDEIEVNGGNSGSKEYLGCNSSFCNTKEYIEYINKINLCGSSKWRLPSRAELLNLITNSSVAPRIDRAYFPDTLYEMGYWTSNSYSNDTSNAWAISFQSGIPYWFPKNKPLAVRLVHSE